MPAVFPTVSPAVASIKKKSRGRMPDGRPNPVDTHVGQRIKLRRQTLKLSQEAMAQMLGITFQQIQKYERGDNRLSASRLWDCACVLNTPVEFFFQDMDATTCSCSPRLQYRPAAGTVSQDDELPVNNDDVMSRSESVLLVSAFNRIDDRLLAQYLFAVITKLGHCQNKTPQKKTPKKPKARKVRVAAAANRPDKKAIP